MSEGCLLQCVVYLSPSPFLFPVVPTLEHRASVKPFVSL
jgi:hypothetical protein